jgi:hypothetical protein
MRVTAAALAEAPMIEDEDGTPASSRAVVPRVCILLEQDGTDQPDDGVSLEKVPTTSVRHLISPFNRSIKLVLWS